MKALTTKKFEWLHALNFTYTYSIWFCTTNACILICTYSLQIEIQRSHQTPSFSSRYLVVALIACPVSKGMSLSFLQKDNTSDFMQGHTEYFLPLRTKNSQNLFSTQHLHHSAQRKQDYPGSLWNQSISIFGHSELPVQGKWNKKVRLVYYFIIYCTQDHVNAVHPSLMSQSSQVNFHLYNNKSPSPALLLYVKHAYFFNFYFNQLCHSTACPF